MAILRMTRAEYEAKYGVKAPASSSVPMGQNQQQPEANTEGYGKRVGSVIKKAGEGVYEAISGTGEFQDRSILGRSIGATQKAFHAPVSVAYESLPGFARKGLKAAGEGIGKGFNKVTDTISDIPAVQKLAMKIPEGGAVDETLKTLTSTGALSGDILTTGAAAKGLDYGAKKVSQAVGKGGELIKKAGVKVNRSAYDLTADEARLVQNNKIQQAFLEKEISKLKPGSKEALALKEQLDDVRANSPITRPDTALERGIAGTEKQIGVQSGAEKLDLWKNQIEPALDKSKAVITKNELFSKAKQRIASEVEPGRKAALQNAYESLLDDYKNIDNIPIKVANQIKSSFDKFTPAKIFKGQDIASELKTLKADMADAIRTKTYASIDDINIKMAYRDYANLKQLEQVGIKALTEGGKRGGFGSFWSTLKDQVTVPIKTVGAKVLYRVGDKLEFVGERGVKTLGQHLDNLGVTVNIKGVPNKQGGFLGKHTVDLTTKNKTTAAQIENARALETVQPAGGSKSVNLLDPNYKPGVGGVRPGSVEQMLESGTGWGEGLKQMFDTALRQKDALLIKALINQKAVPKEYLQRFAADIDKIIK